MLLENFVPLPTCEMEKKEIDLNLADWQFDKLNLGSPIYVKCPVGFLVLITVVRQDYGGDIWQFCCTNCLLNEAV